MIPIDGTCPNCRQTLLWGELVHRHRLKELKAHISNDGSKVKQKRGKKKKETASKHWTEELHVN